MKTMLDFDTMVDDVERSLEEREWDLGTNDYEKYFTHVLLLDDDTREV